MHPEMYFVDNKSELYTGNSIIVFNDAVSSIIKKCNFYTLLFIVYSDPDYFSCHILTFYVHRCRLTIAEADFKWSQNDWAVLKDQGLKIETLIASMRGCMIDRVGGINIRDLWKLQNANFAKAVICLVIAGKPMKLNLRWHSKLKKIAAFLLSLINQ